MNILSISKLKKEFTGEVLFENISFDINSKDKIALIGKNGTGKSTLLKMITSEESIDHGQIHRNQKARIGYLSQSVIKNTTNTLHEEMLEVFQDIIFLEQKLGKLTSDLAIDPHNEEMIHKYSKMEHSFNVMGGYDYHYKVDMILSKFGFTKEEYNRKINTFSGGEKTRVAFSKILLEQPDLLILDEPTNHLDIEIIDWLEDYLNKYDGAVLVVTHDKYFISKVCKKIIEIENHTCHIYHGSFDQYEEERMKRYEQLLRLYKRQQKEIAHLQSFVDRFKHKASKAASAKDRQKKLDRIKKIDKPHHTKRKVKMNFEDKRATVEVILQAKNLSIGYDKALLSNISFSMRGFDKLAIVGPNGTGKTTLLKAIEKKLKPLKGRVEFLREYKIGYFDQNQETLHYQKTIFEEIHDYYPMYTIKDVRSVAARFLFFGDDLEKPISILSGGEKVRLVLLLLMLEDPDLLILDEPTNHLDIETKDIIEDVINTFSGPVIFVSHDRYFINKIATKLVHLSTTEAVEFEGTYDEFKIQEQNKIKVKNKTKRVKTKTINYQKELLTLESKVKKLSDKIEKLKQQTFEEENYFDKRKMSSLNQEINTLEDELHNLELNYITLLEESEREEV